MRRAVLAAGLVGLAGLAGLATACSSGADGSPASFTPDGIRDEVVSAVPRGWDVGTATGRDPGSCAVTCIGRATMRIDTGASAPREQLTSAVRGHGWRTEAVAVGDPATAKRYPLRVTFTKVFRDRDGKSGSYELIPLRVAGDTVTVQVEIDAHDLEPGES